MWITAARHGRVAYTGRMEIRHEEPPAWIMEGCMSKFRVDVDHTYWTYGDVIYNPGGHELHPAILAHESVHVKQQAEYIEYPEGEQPGIAMKCEAHQDQWFEHKLEDGTDCPGPGEPLARGKDAWWKRYLVDPEFRLEQELQAHGVEYIAYCEEQKDRNHRASMLRLIASRLSGPLYQAAITKQEAMTAIKEIAKAV